ncbi:MAG: hypothetical protein WC676_01460 [Candidatus Omnitrophota bacterium]
MRERIKKFFAQPKAQTVTELAIFGAILIFVLGAMIRYAVNFNYVQNQSLGAMRLALQNSFLSGQANNTSRNTASVLFIEDRKTVETGKYGSSSRTPYILGGTGTFTRNLFMGTDFGHTEQIPVQDIHINGKQFNFSTASFKIIQVPGASGNPHFGWNEMCLPGNIGCPVAYTKIVNADDSFCAPAASPYCSEGRGSCNAAQINERFDLDRDGDTDVEGVPITRCRFSWQWKPVDIRRGSVDVDKGKNISLDLDGDLKEEFVQKACGFDGKCDAIATMRNTGGLDTICQGGTSNIETFYVMDYQDGDIDTTYNTWDERGGYTPATAATGRPQGTRPGFQQDSYIRSVCFEGTHMSVEEGKLYDDDKQYTRHTQKRNCTDVIERQFQLSNDTGRMWNCLAGDDNIHEACGEVPFWARHGCLDLNPNDSEYCNYGSDSCGSHGDKCAWNPGCDNPAVEVCVANAGECSSEANLNQTCYNKAEKMLYVRSAIADSGGRKWVTPVDDVNPVK